jgi:hypothetical protein
MWSWTPLSVSLLGGRACDRLGDARERRRPVDQDLQLTATANRRITNRPQVTLVRGVQAMLLSDALEASAVMRARHTLDPVADPRIQPISQRPHHEAAYPTQS